MDADTALLWVSAAALAASALALTGLAWRQPRYRGARWWVGGLWLAAAGIAIAAAAPAAPVALAAANTLLALWPLLTLRGLRRFHARLELPGGEHSDLAILLLAGLGAASGPLWPADSSAGAAVPSAALLMAHLYTASLLFGGPEGRAAVPLRLIGGTLTAIAFAPMLLSASSGPGLAPIEARAISAALGSVLLAFTVLELVWERTERQLRDSRRRLRVLANTDTLTNVPNRRHFHDLAQAALLADDPGSAALLMFDIDHFKRINDHLGHDAGDRALRLVATSMQEHLRLYDLAGRHGGDEFVLLLRRTSAHDAIAVAGRIAKQLQDQSEGALLPRLTLSFGVVQVAPGETVDNALRRADRALYEAKRQGRSRAVAAAGGEDEPVFTESQRLGLTPF
jgi:diguanylate cyclase (GGDEF)-like protein